MFNYFGHQCECHSPILKWTHSSLERASLKQRWPSCLVLIQDCVEIANSILDVSVWSSSMD